MTAPALSRLLTRGITRTLLTPHAPEHYARALGVTRSDDPTGATVVSVDRPVADVTVLTLRLPTGVGRPAPGEALQVGVVVDGVVHRRHYSPVDPASRADGLATIAVRRHPGGVVSEHLWAEATAGMRLLLGAPVGEIALPEARPADVLLVSGGSGITPVLAIASTLAGEGHCGPGATGRVSWLHYARRAEEVPFADRLAELAGRGVDVRVVSTAGRTGAASPPKGTDLAGPEGATAQQDLAGQEDAAPSSSSSTSNSPADLAGHLTAGHLTEVAPWHPDAEIYLCGPEALADGLAEALGPERFAEVHRERFTATTGPVPDGDGGTVTHVTSGVTAHNSGTTLLEGAEAAGLTPKHGCRMGICHTCTAVRRTGATRDLRTGVVDTEPDCHVQICVSAPVGDVEIEL